MFLLPLRIRVANKSGKESRTEIEVLQSTNSEDNEIENFPISQECLKRMVYLNI